MRIALLAHAPVLGGSTDLLIQARDFFQQRGHIVQVIFGEDAHPKDSRVEGSWILPSTRRSWRKTLETYRNLVESFHPDPAYAAEKTADSSGWLPTRIARQLGGSR